MKKNNAFSLIELIFVVVCFGMVTAFFWVILESSSKDSYTLNDKVEVQTSVTSLMNIIQKDVQEAKLIRRDDEIPKKVVFTSVNNGEYKFTEDDYVPGRVSYYTIKYIENGTEKTIPVEQSKEYTSNQIKYNGQDYENTAFLAGISYC